MKQRRELLRLLNGPHLCMLYFAESVKSFYEHDWSLPCATLFNLMAMDCPTQFQGYGWNHPRQGDQDGYFYLYSDNDKTYFMEFPPLEKMEE